MGGQWGLRGAGFIQSKSDEAEEEDVQRKSRERGGRGALILLLFCSSSYSFEVTCCFRLCEKIPPPPPFVASRLSNPEP
jgi:hypothetical protein